MIDILKNLNEILLDEMPKYQDIARSFSNDEKSQFNLYRTLVNLRQAIPASDIFLRLQDKMLKANLAKRGVVSIKDLKRMEDNIYLWQGDITRLEVDAIVNAANDTLLGCFEPCHGCIDNAIHTMAGVQLRYECSKIIKLQGRREKTGKAKITLAYNLPCKNVIHTVGPIIAAALSDDDCKTLASCYKSCMDIAIAYEIKSLAFCCISTGEYKFPNDIAAKIATSTVRDYLADKKTEMSVIFNVFKDIDYEIYKELLG